MWDFSSNDDPPFFGCGQLPEHIRSECAVIRSTWSVEERLRRSGHADVDVSLLYVRANDDYRDHPTPLYALGALDGRIRS